MEWTEIGEIAAEPVSVAEAKAWCRIERSDEDGLIAGLIRAARETVERETGLVLARREFRLALTAVPRDRRVVSPVRPLASVSAIRVRRLGGDWHSVPPGEAVAERFGGVEALRFSEMVAILGEGGVEIDLSAGFAPGKAPETLRHAVMRIVAAGYESRAPGAAMPAAARDAIAAYREVRI
ncbi:head-tail connector protein [Aureimonas psammosilenae]|uniref:head-tail connector protein n=1 Tax=Aureimonas psammosilenae TaxID=2495496 RepID=UPI00186A7336|nr:head-tail connector protein [Aureimonas psammosilenae]